MSGAYLLYYSYLSSNVSYAKPVPLGAFVPRGGTLIFSHIPRLGPFFGFKILNFNIFLGFQKNEYFFGV